MFQRPQSALALRASALLLVFEKFTGAYLFQIALEIMWLPVQSIWYVRHQSWVLLPVMFMYDWKQEAQ